ncbi:baseplate J/gp47 family protein [Sporosarcina sp. FSL W7-1349]|uniref:baseplate J/gp47 family protein n=1 Tax=Sporosarcina sp. FSL W7-1349 TaxID=2921561 RepID=UPI0030FCE6D4
MFEYQTFETITDRMIAFVEEWKREKGESIDIREGAVVYDMSAMTSKELQEFYIALDGVILETYPETASRPNLIKRAAEYGIVPDEATHAVLKGDFNIDIPIGSRFSLGELNYVAIQRISPGVYEMECETSGIIGNTQFGSLIPIEYIDGLQTAELTELLIPGEDEEETEVFRRRFFLTRKQIPYGGNRDDYYQKVLKIDGVGGMKSYRAPNGGGTVGVTIIASDYSVPTPTLINEAQTIIDPIPNNGEGLGVAPYGHRVTVKGVEEVVVDIAMKLVLSNATPGQLQPEVEAICEEYLLSLRKKWSENDVLVVRKLQIEASAINISGIADITESTINGIDSNLILTRDQIPVLGVVTLSE